MALTICCVFKTFFRTASFELGFSTCFSPPGQLLIQQMGCRGVTLLNVTTLPIQIGSFSGIFSVNYITVVLRAHSGSWSSTGRLVKECMIEAAEDKDLPMQTSRGKQTGRSRQIEKIALNHQWEMVLGA